jgi:glycosyltransferase involved in cell wall biosynthesis
VGTSVQNPSASDADRSASDPTDPPRIEFSFIVPTLNEEKLIESTLSSLQKCQQFSREIIVSDGNSTDRTVEIAAPYADRIVMAKRSASSGRNTGARIARGQYLIFVDADTAIPSIDDFMTIAVRRFRENPKLVGLTVKVKATPPDDRSVAMRIFYGASNITCWLFNNLLRKGCAPGIFQMINADVFRATGGYNEDLAAGQDVELFARVAKFGRTAYETSIHVFTSPRRPARLGVARLLTVQLINGISVLIFRKSLYKEWKSVR